MFFDESDCKYAVIYPISPELIGRITGKRNVFCKYIGKPQRTRICKGTKLMFYASGGSYEVTGEATVRQVDLLSPADAVGRYRDRLFISKSELDDYTRKFLRPNGALMLVLVLAEIRRYKTPIKLPKPVTMAGLSLTKEKYETLTQGGPASAIPGYSEDSRLQGP